MQIKHLEPYLVHSKPLPFTESGDGTWGFQAHLYSVSQMQGILKVPHKQDLHPPLSFTVFLPSLREWGDQIHSPEMERETDTVEAIW